MANSKIDFSTLTDVIPLAVSKLSDLIKKNALEYGKLDAMISILDGVDVQKKIGFLGELTAIGMTSGAGCTYNTVAGTIPTTEKEWNPILFDTKLTLCSEDIEGTIAELSLKKGVNRNDMSDTEYMDMFIMALEIAINKMYWRIIFHADKDAANIDDSPAGIITAGVDVKLLNMIDGFWKRARVIVAAAPAQLVAIAANAQATTALQNSTFTPALALTAANNIYYNAPVETQAKMLSGSYAAWTTVAFYNKLIQNFQGFQLESMLSNQTEGIKGGININGISFMPVFEWDDMINRFENLGAKKNNPFRVACFEKTNFLVGIPSMTEWGQFKSIFSEETDQMYIKIKDKIDAQFYEDSLIMVAF